eukprot:scaffold14290_cov125-Isochrysis_galbana.AAC.9
MVPSGSSRSLEVDSSCAICVSVPSVSVASPPLSQATVRPTTRQTGIKPSSRTSPRSDGRAAICVAPSAGIGASAGAVPAPEAPAHSASSALLLACRHQSSAATLRAGGRSAYGLRRHMASKSMKSFDHTAGSCNLGGGSGDAESPDVDGGVQPALLNHLRRHPKRRPDCGALGGGAVGGARDSKVGELHLTLGRQEQVAGLYVTVHQVAAVVQVRQAARSRRAHGGDLRLRESGAAAVKEEVGNRTHLAQLENKPRILLVLELGKKLHCALVRRSAHEAHLLANFGRGAGAVKRHDLDGNVFTVQSAPMHDAVRAAADELAQSESRGERTHHRWSHAQAVQRARRVESGAGEHLSKFSCYKFIRNFFYMAVRRYVRSEGALVQTILYARCRGLGARG